MVPENDFAKSCAVGALKFGPPLLSSQHATYIQTSVSFDQALIRVEVLNEEAKGSQASVSHVLPLRKEKPTWTRASAASAVRTLYSSTKVTKAHLECITLQDRPGCSKCRSIYH
jgi:hypothetical protein